MRLEELKELRKSALAGADHSQRLTELQELVRTGPSPESELALKIAENTTRSLWGRLERCRVDFVRGVAGAGLSHPQVVVRKNAFYRLAELGQVLQSNACSEDWLDTEVLDACQRGLSDPGTDWDARGNPLQRKGTLTLADKSADILKGLSDEARSHRCFLGALQGLDRVNGFMATGSLDPNYARKLMDKLLDTLEGLLHAEASLPEAAPTPALFPSYLAEFLNTAASTEYRHVPLERMIELVRWIPRRKRYVWNMVELLREDEYAPLRDMLWAHIARELEGGHFAAELKHGLRQSVIEGHLPCERVPEELRSVLLKGT
ncbi:MAG: hypothetical protein U0931_13490 [Vulcanimicrobiota bacterium]